MSCRECDERVKKARGCKVNGYGKAQFKWRFGKHELDECPKSFIARGSDHKDYYSLWQAGLMLEVGLPPGGGGFLCLPCAASDAIGIMRNLRSELDQEELKKNGPG